MKAPSSFHLDELSEVFLRLLRVDIRRRVVAEPRNSESQWRSTEDGSSRLVEGFDDDAPGGELLANGAVGEDHGRRLPGHNARRQC